MTDRAAEIPLAGGRVTTGVVRVGDTVRRPPTTNSAFVRRLLDHLAEAGFAGAPAFLGTDDRQRDVFTFIAGEVPTDLGLYDDRTLRSAAALIRHFHDLTTGLVALGSAADGIEVICHNDLSPCNFVFQDGAPVAMIDFDAAAPGSRAHDLGYAAWLWLDIGSPAVAPSEQARRLKIFLDASGITDAGKVLNAMKARQRALATEGRRRGDAPLAAWAADCLAWTERNFDVLIGA